MIKLNSVQDREDSSEFFQLGIPQYIPACIVNSNIVLFISRGEKNTIEDAEEVFPEAAMYFGINISDICIVEIIFNKDSCEILEILEQSQSSKSTKSTTVH